MGWKVALDALTTPTTMRMAALVAAVLAVFTPTPAMAAGVVATAAVAVVGGTAGRAKAAGVEALLLTPQLMSPRLTAATG